MNKQQADHLEVLKLILVMDARHEITFIKAKVHGLAKAAGASKVKTIKDLSNALETLKKMRHNQSTDQILEDFGISPMVWFGWMRLDRKQELNPYQLSKLNRMLGVVDGPHTFAELQDVLEEVKRQVGMDNFAVIAQYLAYVDEVFPDDLSAHLETDYQLYLYDELVNWIAPLDDAKEWLAACGERQSSSVKYKSNASSFKAGGDVAYIRRDGVDLAESFSEVSNFSDSALSGGNNTYSYSSDSSSCSSSDSSSSDSSSCDSSSSSSSSDSGSSY